jgi:hypothetical protein
MSRGRTRLRNHYLKQEQANVLADAILKHPGARIVGHRSAEGETARKRGIPIQAPGVGGTQRGTRPGAFIERIKDTP